MQNQFRITGGRRLSGTIAASGNKNAALPLVALSVMLEGPLVLRNLPRIGDVEAMLTLLAEMKIGVTDEADGAVRLDPARADAPTLDAELARKLRGSILLAAPCLARFGEVDLPYPGGDRIGRRRIDTHLAAFRALGAEVEARADGYRIRRTGPLRGARILLDEASVTATENAVMAAAAAEGETEIGNAACEPHVQELCRALVAAGASIDGIGSNRLRIRGADALAGVEATVGPDAVEIGSLVVLAAVTGSDLTVTGVRHEDLEMILLQFGRLGIRTEADGDRLRVPPGQALEVEADLRSAIPKIEDAPWPGFPADLTSIAVVAASQARGAMLVFEKMFESRLFFVDQLIDMGARIVLCDPHRAVVTGPSPLRARPIMSPDIRAGMALLIAALSAEGTSEMRSIDQIDRGYERIDERLNALGAAIERV